MTKMYWGVKIQIHSFLTSVTDRDQWWSSAFSLFIAEESVIGAHYIGAMWAPQPVWIFWIQ